MARPPAFTLIELLAVIAIIGLLVALLVPALAKAQERGKRVKCASQLKQIAAGISLYAGDNEGQLPPSIDSTRAASSYEVRDNNQSPFGLGLLCSNYLPAQPSAVWHCPSLNSQNSSLPGHGMDQPTAYGEGMSGFNAGAARVIIGYNYRGPSFYNTHTNRALRIGQNPASTLVVADIIDNRFGRAFAHKDGYNIVRLSGSARWVPDATGRVDTLVGPDSNGRATPSKDEDAYRWLESVP